MDRLTPKKHHSLHTVPINIDIFRVYSAVVNKIHLNFCVNFSILKNIWYIITCNHEIKGQTGLNLQFPVGHYFYTESSRPRRPRQKARLISPDNPGTTGSCVSFWYHMYGTTMGTLNVYARSGGVLGSPVWTKSGNQGNSWFKGQVSVIQQSTWQVKYLWSTVIVEIYTVKVSYTSCLKWK